MPHLGAAAAVGAGTQLLGGILGAKGQHDANKANSQATAEALAFERDKEARRRQEYDQNVALQAAQFEAQQAQEAPFRIAHAGLLQKYYPGMKLKVGQVAPKVDLRAIAGYGAGMPQGGPPAPSPMSPPGAMPRPGGTLGTLPDWASQAWMAGRK